MQVLTLAEDSHQSLFSIFCLSAEDTKPNTLPHHHDRSELTFTSKLQKTALSVRLSQAYLQDAQIYLGL